MAPVTARPWAAIAAIAQLVQGYGGMMARGLDMVKNFWHLKFGYELKGQQHKIEHAVPGFVLNLYGAAD